MNIRIITNKTRRVIFTPDTTRYVQVLNSNITCHIAEWSDIIIRVAGEIHIQRMAVAVERTTIGIVITYTLGNRDIGIHDGIYILPLTGCLHLCSKGFPVAG